MADEMGLTPQAAQGYEEFFVPAIFAQWPPLMLREIDLQAGEDLLDVGCGTGVLCREALKAVGADGSVTGIDLSESMLGVAAVASPGARLHQGDATEIPCADESFDVVTSAFMLMFVPDQMKALAEMWRVLRPGGRLIVSVWEALSENPVYTELVEIARNRLGEAAGESIAWPFVLGESDRLPELFESADVHDVKLRVQDGVARFPSVEDLVRTEFEAWLLADSVNEAQLSVLVEDARARFVSYVGPGGMSFPFRAIFAVADKS